MRRYRHRDSTRIKGIVFACYIAPTPSMLVEFTSLENDRFAAHLVLECGILVVVGGAIFYIAFFACVVAESMSETVVNRGRCCGFLQRLLTTKARGSRRRCLLMRGGEGADGG